MRLSYEIDSGSPELRLVQRTNSRHRNVVDTAIAAGNFTVFAAALY